MQFRRLVALALVAACVSGARPDMRAPALAAATPQVPTAQQLPVASASTISGTVFRSDGTTPAGDVRLRLRNLDTGTIVGNTVSDKQGRYSFTVSGPGHYVVEVVDKNDKGGVQAVGDPITLTAGTSVTVSAILLGGHLLPMAAILIGVASGVGLTAWAVGSNGTTSPER